tara:strand:- start:324 stop:809 length:486 start_codon:yes stop_codon:yes gene_type:complete
MYKKITAACILVAIVSCKNDDSKNNEKEVIKTASWLLGKWENKSSNGVLSEIWTKANDSTYQGESYFINEKDTIHYETIVLQQIGETLVYKATVKGQNHDKAVSFSQDTPIENQLIFVNPKHDYPQKISYQKDAKNNLVATISGLIDGKQSTEKYTLAKSK